MRRRRFPWLSREDHGALSQMDDVAATAFERLLHAQGDEEADYRRHVTLESDLAGGTSIDQLLSARAARLTFGAGGGRQRPRLIVDA